MVDRSRVAAILNGLRCALRDLDRYAGTVSAERLACDPDVQNMVLHAIYRAAQASIDLAHHIIAEEGLELPATYRAGFATLASAAWIDGELAGRLAGWAGLRNVIAHAYVDVAFARVHAALGERDDLHRFAAAMARRISAGS